ncbi:virulence-associated structural protein [Synechococcus phage S-CAM3]|uniref:Virulence-associated structural protein n=1 Tax=Synechococcus phage S-CAM3 TaxID=1883366 RepID=A0A1D8KIW8_9CAUD|nr:virulence-associated structural protein [Synechococcus phage S-CAM3]AOV58592.1 virulence-associated structural protein [Synechococcus phage S-CAM3]AOV58831.1 virulence-associated structural protein [Synechococcus phage S-CAM3]AOV59070.1 virulence-associated structural protein [Synechococcus phage S-CAM3]
MPQKTNLNAIPYFDDYDSRKDFYKVLFRPSYPIQGRELNSIQSILQNQIEKYGKYQFKQGDLVIPGEVGLNTKLDFVKLSSVSEVAVNVDGEIVYQKYDIDGVVGQKISGLSSGVVALVLATEKAGTNNADTLYVKYLTAGDSGDEETFRQGETLEIIDGVNSPLLVVGTDGSVLPTSISVIDSTTGESSFVDSPAMGYGSAVKVEEGIYFVNGFFVRNDAGLILVSGYSQTPSTKVGFNVSESVVTPEQDSSLYDNATGSSNFASPGAHRLQIELSLVKYDYTETPDKNFIQLLSIRDGVVERQVKKADYSLLEETLARRTYDESGDYVVDNFDSEVREYYQQNGNLGVYSLGSDGTVNGVDPTEARDKLAFSIGPGKAYVRGYEIVNKETKYIEFDKARETLTRDNINIKTKGLAGFNITNVFNSIPLNAEGADLTAYPTIFLNSVYNDGTTGTNDLESSTNYIQTVSRRGEFFDKDTAIKTIYLTGAIDFGLIDESSIESNTPNDKIDLKNIYFVATRTSTGAVSTIKSVETISFAKVNRPEIGDVTSQFLQLTVAGRKDYLDNLFIEYDDNVSIRRRLLYKSEADAQQEINEIGHISDYDQSITPLIGVAKPKDFSLVKRPVGFNEDKDIIISKGRLSSGVETYNGLFNLSYFNPVFFTRLLVDSDISADFSPGKYITGTQSGAYGVIEGNANGFLSSGKSLYVKTLSGNFVPGETIISEEGGILRIAKENTISHFVVSTPGTGYLSATKISLNGVQFEPTDVEVGVNGGILYKVNVLNRDAVSTEYTTPPEVAFDGTFNIKAKVLPVLFKNTVLTFSAQNVKSVHSSYGNGNVFTADLETVDTSYSDIKTVTEFTFAGTKGYKYLECTGFGADASRYLIQGDVIQFNDDAGVIHKFVVDYATNAEGTTKSRIYINGSLPENVTASSVVRLRPVIENSATSSLVFPTGSKEVSSLIKTTENTKIKYYTRRDFVTTGTSSGGSVTFAAQLDFGTQRFVEFDEKDFIITILDKGNSDKVENGDIIYLRDEFVTILNTTDETSGLSSGSITLTFPSNYFGSNVTNFPKLKLTATIEISKARPKLKTAIRDRRIIIRAAGDKVIPLRGINYDDESTDSYSYSDAFKLKYIYEGSASSPPTVDVNGNLVVGTDITDRFTFDDGQRETFYDVSRIVLKPGFDAPVGQIVVSFDYFEHSQGDFCTVDSYIHEAGVVADEIPSFNSTVYGIVSLKNSIDFRPKVDTRSIITGFQDTSLLSQADFISFTGEGGSVSSTPSSSKRLPYTMSFSESQYLDRIDGVFLNKKGEFVIKSGNASLNPTKPEIIEDGIPLYYMYIPAFTKSSKDVRVIPVDNRRYTMKDIGKLEKRIERLEYYTTLSVLEQQALNMQVKDTLGIDKSKSGFVVDNFETHQVGNVKSLDYKCSIDPQQSVLRPQSKEDSFKLVEFNTRDDQRQNSGYANSNMVITLPYTDVTYASNEFATKTLNPNPFVIIQYVGDASLIPNIDQWYNTTVAPLVTENNTNLFSIFLGKNDVQAAFASIYNSFVINWVGVNKSFYNINSFGDSNSSVSDSTVSSASISSSSNVSPQNNEIAKGVGYKTVNGSNVANALRFFARSIPVKFVLKRLKPKTQLFVFMDQRDVNRWVNPDSRFTGIAGNSLTTFNNPLTTDEYGNASGIILIPAGLAPRMNTSWTGDINTLQYDDTSEELFFSTGIKNIRFTSSASDGDRNVVDSYAEVKFYATGVLPQNPASIISTAPAIFKANEGVQLIDSNTENTARPNPLAQTFKVENFEGGMFATGVDLFFSKKSSTIPLRVYLTNIESQKPSKYIVPGSQITLYPDTFLKVFSSGNLSIKIGEYVTGQRSSASGPINKVLDKNNFEVVPSSNGEVSITNEQVYTFVLGNHNGVSFIANEDVTLTSVTQFNNSNNATVGLKIAKDSGRVTSLDVTELGSGYEGATLTIESPQLPGGSNATGSAKVHGGQLYLAEVALGGRGYTEAPSVVIRGSGNGATGAVIQSKIIIDEPAVRMGIASDDGSAIDSTTPTRFNFDYPVYLQDNTEYALNIECDDTEYEIWSSRLGETDISSGLVVNAQPLLGSVFKSQNVDNWTEDLFEDIKFTLYRAQFDISRTAELLIKNDDLGYEKLTSNAFETYALANSTATSSLFKNNSSIVSVYHRDHGFEDTGYSKVFFRGVDDFAGYNEIDIESTLFTISNAGIDSYTIEGPTRAAATGFGGGDTILATYNRKYEKLYAQIPYLQVSNTKINSFVKTTDVVPVDSNTTNYKSYDVSEMETTFLNQEHYFLNQKMISSRINEVMNNTGSSLLYKISLSSDTSHLSPLIDLRNASVKTVSNRVENSTGSEDRFGKRYQNITFYPVYKFTITGNNEGLGGDDILATINQNVTGLTSGAQSEVLRVVNNDVYVKIKNSLRFNVGEELFFSTQSEDGGDYEELTITISDTGIYDQLPSYVVGATVTSINPSVRSEKYENKISGKVISWDQKTKVLVVENDKQPIEDDFTSEITLGSDFARDSQTSSQLSDIFRVGELLDFDGSSFETSKFYEVKSMEFTQGIDYVPETGSLNTSGVAKYVTKEVFINTPAESLNVYLTLNVRDVENVKVYYKIKPAASQQNFDDINWEYFNTDGNPDQENEIATSENSISGQFEKQSSYQELRYTVEELTEFSSFGIKIVMKTDDPAYVPKIQDLRAVASF